MRRFLIAPLTALLAMTGAAGADPVLGLWLSPPDPKGQTGHVEISRCGNAICGTLIKAFDPAGQQIVTANVGKQLLWGMKPEGNGRYNSGRVFVPLFANDYAARMQLSGQALKVSGCAIGICKSQIWQRVH